MGYLEQDGSKPLTDVELLSLEIEMKVRSKISSIERISVILLLSGHYQLKMRLHLP
ncbi:MAG: hypothetical protein JO297_00800 [Nitrososphaeraceae archaeon]|nr:hypothetical protein [Nitrososphaeraceae archaeon]